MQDELLKIKEAAKLLGINEQTLRKWVENKKIECIILPTGHRRFKISDINRLLNNNEDISNFDKELLESRAFNELKNRVKKIEERIEKL